MNSLPWSCEIWCPGCKNLADSKYSLSEKPATGQVNQVFTAPLVNRVVIQDIEMAT